MSGPDSGNRLPETNRLVFVVPGVAILLLIVGASFVDWSAGNNGLIAFLVAVVPAFLFVRWIRRDLFPAQPGTIIGTDKEQGLFLSPNPINVESSWSPGLYYVVVTNRRILLASPPDVRFATAIHIGGVAAAGLSAGVSSQIMRGLVGLSGESVVVRAVDWAVLLIGAVVGYVMAQHWLFKILNPQSIRFSELLQQIQRELRQPSGQATPANHESGISADRLALLAALAGVSLDHSIDDVTAVETSDTLSVTGRSGRFSLTTGSEDIQTQLRSALSAFWATRRASVQHPS